ncbi:MAG TPA: LysR substrate-binding domain-containing protein, partial [Lysobacter sp.]|nr:LysR substrate-binding domain-containing protein [Lysobacter sp.]
AGVLDFSLDLGCVEGATSHSDLQVLQWRMDDLRVCVSTTHPLARRKRLRPDDFAGARWILREAGSATRAQAERVLALLPQGETVLELDQSEAIKQAVIAGLGMALLPAVSVEHAQAGGRLVVLSTPFLPLSRPLSFIVHRRRHRDALLRAFLASVGITASD